MTIEQILNQLHIGKSDCPYSRFQRYDYFLFTVKQLAVYVSPLQNGGFAALISLVHDMGKATDAFSNYPDEVGVMVKKQEINFK